MNYESYVIRLRNLRQQIAWARAEVLARPSYAGADALAAERATHAALMLKIDGWRFQLEMMARDLKSRAGLVGLRAQGRLDYAGRQSVRDQQANFAGLAVEIRALLDELNGLLDDLVRVDAALKALADAFAELMKALDSGQGCEGTQLHTFETVLHNHDSAADTPHGPLSGPPVSSMLVAVLAIYAILSKRR